MHMNDALASFAATAVSTAATVTPAAVPWDDTVVAAPVRTIPVPKQTRPPPLPTIPRKKPPPPPEVPGGLRGTDVRATMHPYAPAYLVGSTACADRLRGARGLRSLPWTAWCRAFRPGDCGKCLAVKNRRTGASVVVRIVDHGGCSDTDGTGMDLDQAAFGAIDSDGRGYADGFMRVDVAQVDCALARPLPPPARPEPADDTPPAAEPTKTPPPPPAKRGSDAGLRPQLFRLGGRDHAFQLPPGSSAKGLVVFFPGCYRTTWGFWPAGSRPGFLGFPQDLSHAKQVLNRGYALLVLVPPPAKVWMCWSGGAFAKEAVDAIRRFRAAHSLASKPLVLMGASSGGNAVAKVYDALGRRGVAGLVFEVSTRHPAEPGYPPTVYVTMGGDPGSVRDVRQRARESERVAAVTQAPTPVTKTFFSDQLASYSPEQSARMADAIRGSLDSKGFLKKDPKRDKAWVAALRKLPFVKDSFATKTSPLVQAMNFAYGKHEHVATYTTAALEWIEGGGRGDFARLAEKGAVDKPGLLRLRGG